MAGKLVFGPVSQSKPDAVESAAAASGCATKRLLMFARIFRMGTRRERITVELILSSTVTSLRRHLFYSVLERLAGCKLGGFGGFDLDFFARLGVSSGSSLTLDHFERAEARDGHRVTFCQRVADA